jgi:hypothetical protein
MSMKNLEKIVNLARGTAFAGAIALGAVYATGCEEEESYCCEHTKCTQEDYRCDDILNPTEYDKNCVTMPDGEKKCCECEYYEPEEDDDIDEGWDNY